MEEPNTLNIPAYKRKRSLAAKSRSISKKTAYKAKPKKRRTTSRKTKSSSGFSRLSQTARKIQDNTFEEPFTTIPLNEKLPSEELFEDIEVKKSKKSLREWLACGHIEGYFDKIDVAIIKVTKVIRKGDTLLIEKNKGLFETTINSMQINRKDVSLARSGSDIGLKVDLKPKVGATVYKLIE